MEEIKLKIFEEQDLKKIKEWYTDITEWKSWDAPWEEIEYNEDIIKNISDGYLHII